MENQKPDTKSPTEMNKTTTGTMSVDPLAKITDAKASLEVDLGSHNRTPQEGTVVVAGTLTVACPTPFVGHLTANVAAQTPLNFSEISFRTYARVLNTKISDKWSEIQQKTIGLVGQATHMARHGAWRFYKVKFTGPFEATFEYPHEALEFVNAPPPAKSIDECCYELASGNTCNRMATRTHINGKKYCNECFKLATKMILPVNQGRCPDCGRITNIRREAVSMGTMGNECISMRDVVEPCICKNDRIVYTKADTKR